MWTCPECGRSFANTHQWHSCVELSLDAKLAEASDTAVELYRAFESAVRSCGEFRIHPQKTRIAYINTMTFAGAKLAKRWIDISFITATPIDDERIRSLECYGPTSFGHTVRLSSSDELNAAANESVRQWLCSAWRRGTQETLDPSARVDPLVGRPLELVLVPLRSRIVEVDGQLAAHLPRYAAEIFEAHQAVVAKVGRQTVTGRVGSDRDRHWVEFAPGTLESMGLTVDDPTDLFLRANL